MAAGLTMLRQLHADMVMAPNIRTVLQYVMKERLSQRLYRLPTPIDMLFASERLKTDLGHSQEYQMLSALVVVEVRFHGRAWSFTLVKFFTTASSRVGIHVVNMWDVLSVCLPRRSYRHTAGESCRLLRGRFWLTRLAQV